MTLTVRRKFSITIETLSDWHIGSGSGRGEIDRTVQLDAMGCPFIPGKTLTGILRDGCELVTQALDEGQSGRWKRWIDYLFGEQPALALMANAEKPRSAVLSIHSAYLETGLRQTLQSKDQLRQVV
ncbi:MAG: RAMP superfamily CRISPR-associated protein, partial [Cyanobacteria bacterium P01_H01_bin.15]